MLFRFLRGGIFFSLEFRIKNGRAVIAAAKK